MDIEGVSEPAKAEEIGALWQGHDRPRLNCRSGPDPRCRPSGRPGAVCVAPSGLGAAAASSGKRVYAARRVCWFLVLPVGYAGPVAIAEFFRVFSVQTAKLVIGQPDQCGRPPLVVTRLAQRSAENQRLDFPYGFLHRLGKDGLKGRAGSGHLFARAA